MSKGATLNTISSDNGIATAVNTNLTRLNTQFQNTLSLDGSTPNAMQADLDMNGQDILNVENINTASIYIDGVRAAAGSMTAVSNGTTPELYGAVGDGVTDDRAAFIRAEASGIQPIILTKDYYLSSNTGNQTSVYEMTGNASVTMGTGAFQPYRYTDNKGRTFSQKINFTATNPNSTGEPTVYSLVDASNLENTYLINQWGRQNMVDQVSGSRTGINAQHFRLLHSGEGDGYTTFWSAFVTAHPRIALSTALGGQNSGGLANGQTNAGSNKVNLYGLGDVVVHDQGYQSVALYNYVGITYFNGTDGTYAVPRLGMYQLSNGSNSIDANYLAGGKTKIAYDATKADIDWGAFVMKAGQKILFDATESATAGKFAATAAGEYYMMKSTATSAIVVGRGADDADVFRVEGSSATSRLSVGSSGTTSYVSAHTTGSDNTTLSLRTGLAGVMGDRLIISPNGSVNVNTSGARLAIAGTNVLNARQTGWAAATGTATRTTFATGTVTTAQLAERVKALIDDLTTHGLIGA